MSPLLPILVAISLCAGFVVPVHAQFKPEGQYAQVGEIKTANSLGNASEPKRLQFATVGVRDEAHTILKGLTETVHSPQRSSTHIDTDWQGMLGFAGANGDVYVVASDSKGNVYIGGEFTVVGNTVANGIAKWDGETWTSLGSGVTGGKARVRALAIMGDTLFAGGQFHNAGGIGATNIARWTGTNWAPLDLGVYKEGEFESMVSTLAVAGGDLFAAGKFTYAGAIEVNNVAKWDGVRWSALGSGLSRTSNSSETIANAMVVEGSNLYIGGYFNRAGGVQATNIAHWNGTKWTSVGSGFDGRVFALMAIGTDLYAGGDFTRSGRTATARIAKWNGSDWSALGAGSPLAVRALATFNGDIYAAAYSFVSRWNGIDWTIVGSANNGRETPAVSSIVVAGTNLIAGGVFSQLERPAAAVAKWDGNAWSSLGTGMAGGLEKPVVHAIVASRDEVYVGGSFALTLRDGQVARNIARWDGHEWNSLGRGVSGANPVVNSLVLFNGNLFVGGNFDAAGDIVANDIARWDGKEWSALGLGFPWEQIEFGTPEVHSLAILGEELYAGGYFRTADGVSASSIARWDGTSWSPVGAGVESADGSFVPQVKTMVAIGGRLFVGGGFTKAGGSDVSHIAEWDGQSWSALALGLPSWVSSLTTFRGDLYAHGWFGSPGVSPFGIAKWNGARWNWMEQGFDSLTSLVGSDEFLYAAGALVNSQGNQVFKWNGEVWSQFGSGMDAFVRTLASSSGYLYAGGSFGIAGDQVAACVARKAVGGSQALILIPPQSSLTSEDNFSLEVTGPVDTPVVISVSIDLQEWMPVATNSLGNGSFRFSDSAVRSTPRFYRATIDPQSQ